MFNPTIKDVMVVATLLPSIIPMLLLKVNSFAFIKLIVSVITAELDCIKAVERKPIVKLFGVEEVKDRSFCFTLDKDNEIRLLLKVFIELIKRIIPPSSNVIVMFFTNKLYFKFSKIMFLSVLNYRGE